jgi:hypothetical protein
MAPIRREARRYLRWTGFVALIFACGPSARQAAAQPASELIMSLREELPMRPRDFGCGDAHEPRGRGIAVQLVQLGKAAVPDILQALDSLEAKGEASGLFPNAAWVFFAYAGIEGPAAVPRLRTMLKNSETMSHQRNLDYAIALSLNLTSYVSGSAARSWFSICRRGEPRDALDELIASLEQNDRSGLESHLGPQARLALDRALEIRPWETILQSAGHSPSGAPNAVGYRFDIAGRWSEPEVTLDVKNVDYGPAPLTSASVTLDTLFSNSIGKACGTYKIEFQRAPELPLIYRYEVNNTDIEGLLRTMIACADK